MNDLTYLSVDLFLYDLYQGFGRGPQQAEMVSKRFWQRLYPDLNGSKPAQLAEKIQEDDAFFASYVELLKDKRERFADAVDGYYYPVKLGDTYALQVVSSGAKDTDQTVAASPEAIQSISTDIVQNRIHQQHGELGESWLLWGQLSEHSQDSEATAKACYKSLSVARPPSWERDYVGQGCFGSAALYELQQLDTLLDNQNKNHHVLICLFPATQTKAQIQKTVGKLYRHLIRLFHYRSKVLWLFEQSRELKGFLREASDKTDQLVSVLPDKVQATPLDLKAMQKHLTDALVIGHLYETRLGYLREQATAISTNVSSYRDRVARMSATEPSSDLAFLSNFVSLAEEKFLQQIQADISAFESALKPLGNFVQTIQGITEIERTQNERTLNQTVAIAGVGISAASLAASSIGDRADSLIQTWRPVPADQTPSATNLWLGAALILIVSLAVGLLFAGITFILVNRKADSP